jgi:glycosyltransferase involved in cell wall biosynthesis
VHLILFTGQKVTDTLFEIPAGVQITRIPLAPRLLMLVDVLRALLQRPNDAILGLGNKGNALSASAARMLGRHRCFWPSLHHDLDAEIEGWTPMRQRRRLRQWRRWLRGAEGLITVSQGLADSFCGLTGTPRTRVHTIYNPIVDDTLIEKADAPPPHPWLAGGGSVIIGVGRLTAQKDFGTLLNAFALIQERRRGCRLLILGEGEERQSLAIKVRHLGLSEHVELVGFRRDPIPWIRAASVLALSSRWEGFGNVLVEALACGIPVVSTDCPQGPSEILDGGRYGRMVPVGDPDALAAALLRTLDDPPDQTLLRERAQVFSVSRSGEQYISLMGLGSHSGKDRN